LTIASLLCLFLVDGDDDEIILSSIDSVSLIVVGMSIVEIDKLVGGCFIFV